MTYFANIWCRGNIHDTYFAITPMQVVQTKGYEKKQVLSHGEGQTACMIIAIRCICTIADFILHHHWSTCLLHNRSSINSFNTALSNSVNFNEFSWCNQSETLLQGVEYSCTLSRERFHYSRGCVSFQSCIWLIKYAGEFGTSIANIMIIYPYLNTTFSLQVPLLQIWIYFNPWMNTQLHPL